MKELAYLILPEIRDAISRKNAAEVLETAAHLHPSDLADILQMLDSEEQLFLFQNLPHQLRVRTFEFIDEEEQTSLIQRLGTRTVVALLESMAHDDRADLVQALPPERVEEYLPLLAQAERTDIRRLIAYAEQTAGAIMTSDYASLEPTVTVEQALASLRKIALKSETIYYIYTVDEQRHLLGFVSLQDLVLSPPHSTLEKIYQRDVVRVRASDDQEEVARKVHHYDFLAMPVVDDENRLVGIVTSDDVMDILEEEATEDIYLYGAAGEPVDLVKDPLGRVVRQRLMWLLLLVLAGFVAGLVMESHEAELKGALVLAFFIPMLTAAGGNAGTQSSTVVIRGLATGDLSLRDASGIVRREISVGLLMGSAMAILVIGRVLLHGDGMQVASTVALAMVVTVTLGATMGGLLPILFARLNLDPALMSGPFLSSTVDIAALVVYLQLARLLLSG